MILMHAMTGMSAMRGMVPASVDEGPYVDDDYVDPDYVALSFAPRFTIVPDEPRERDEERREAGFWLRLWRHLTDWNASPTLKGLEWAGQHVLNLFAA